MEHQIDKNLIDGILTQYNCDRHNLITILQNIQSHYHYLPKEVLLYVAEKMDVSISKIYSVATFYENFSLNPKGKYVIKICDGTACHVRKSVPILEKIYSVLNVTPDNNTTEDMLFTVETVSCLGACGLAPVMMINDKVYPSMTPEKAEGILNDLREGKEC